LLKSFELFETRKAVLFRHTSFSRSIESKSNQIVYFLE